MLLDRYRIATLSVARRVRVGRAVQLALAAAVLTACGADKDPSSSETNMTNVTAGHSGGDPTDGSATDSAADSATDTGEPGLYGDCAQYIECLGAVSPEVAPSAETAYGPASACWNTSAEVMNACLEACSTGLEAVLMTYPEEPKCGGQPGTETAGATSTGAVEAIDYEMDIQPIWDFSCVAGCHTPGGVASADGPILGEGVSYDNIVDKLSSQLAIMPLVAPGDPENSYLWHKLNGTHAEVGGFGAKMPIGPSLAGDKLAMIEQWILAGAKP